MSTSTKLSDLTVEVISGDGSMISSDGSPGDRAGGSAGSSAVGAVVG